mgnify:CR=1 FL=1
MRNASLEAFLPQWLRPCYIVMICLAPLILWSPRLVADQLIVDKAGGSDTYATIKEALQQATDGDHLFIRSGHYLEHNLQVNKSIVIEGEDGAIVDGDHQGYVMVVHADSVTINNLEIHNSKVSYVEDYAGLLFEEVKGGKVTNSRFKGNFFGIYLAKSEGVTIANNELHSKFKRESGAGNGIHLWYCKDIHVHNNRVFGHRDGIYFEFVESSLITENYSENNMRYGLHFMFSDSCAYRNNTFRDNGAGVAVMYTQHVVMEDNTFIHNWGTASYGLLLKEIKYSKVRNNRFEQNTIGLYTEASTDVEITHNEFVENGWAAKVQANSVDNNFKENNFIGNTFDVATNSRQNYNQFDGNYWSHYNGYDLDQDGVGDVPYRPVTLFSYLVQRHSVAIILLRSMLVDLLNAAERVMPVLTPETLVDSKPKMKQIK